MCVYVCNFVFLHFVFSSSYRWHSHSYSNSQKVLPFDDNLCVREPCLNFEQCLSVLKFGNASEFVASDTILFRPIQPVNTFACRCPKGFSGKCILLRRSLLPLNVFLYDTKSRVLQLKRSTHSQRLLYSLELISFACLVLANSLFAFMPFLFLFPSLSSSV